MKFTLILVGLMLSQISLAATVAQKKIKEEMISRADVLLANVEGAREDLEQDDVVNACAKIETLYKLYPAHLTSIGVYMDAYKKKSNTARNEALNQLMFMHKESLLCNQGVYGDQVDPEGLNKELKGIQKSLKKQLKAIKKSDTDQNNSFQYSYEF